MVGHKYIYIYIQCMYGIFGRGIINHKIYGHVPYMYVTVYMVHRVFTVYIRCIKT